VHVNLMLGVASQGFASCHLLSCMAVAGPTESSWVKATGLLWVSILSQTERSLHQPVPLQACGEPW